MFKKYYDYRGVFDGLPECIAIVDENGDIELLNKCFSETIYPCDIRHRRNFVFGYFGVSEHDKIKKAISTVSSTNEDEELSVKCNGKHFMNSIFRALL